MKVLKLNNSFEEQGFYDEFAPLPSLASINTTWRGDIFGGGSSSGGGTMGYAEPEWQRAMRERLATTAEPLATQRLQRAGEPYTGGLVAPLSEYEQTALGGLGDYLNQIPVTEQPL